MAPRRSVPPGASAFGLPRRLRRWLAGEVAALGEGAERWQIGDQVCALAPGGGYA